MNEQEAEGRISEDEVSEPVADEIHEAKDAHKDQADDPGATEGQGVEEPQTGFAPPDPGVGETAGSEVPEGVDALTDEQVAAAQERGGGGGDDDGGDALDVSAVMQEGGADDAADDETSEEA